MFGNESVVIEYMQLDPFFPPLGLLCKRKGHQVMLFHSVFNSFQHQSTSFVYVSPCRGAAETRCLWKTRSSGCLLVAWNVQLETLNKFSKLQNKQLRFVLLSPLRLLSAETDRFKESSLPMSFSPGPADLDLPFDLLSLRLIVPKKSRRLRDLPRKSPLLCCVGAGCGGNCWSVPVLELSPD